MNTWSQFPHEWVTALNSLLTKDFDYPIMQRRPVIKTGGFIAGFLFRWPFNAQAATIAEVIHLGPKWEKLKVSSEREAFLTIAHECVHVAQQARSAPSLPRRGVFYAWWLPRYLLLGIYACFRAWAHWRLCTPRDHPWEKPAYEFEDRLRFLLS